MPVILTVVSYQGAPPSTAISCAFDAQGGTLGRAPENRFVLFDPDKYVSRKHGTIGYRDGTYYFTDTSTAGTYFLKRNLLLQRDTLALLEGDLLRIGKYEIFVNLVRETGVAGQERLEIPPKPCALHAESPYPRLDPPAPPPPSPQSPRLDQDPTGFPARPGSGQELFTAFLESAELSGADWVVKENRLGLMRTVGSLVRDFVEGMMAVLRSRSEIKNQFRLSVTTIRSANNNPLKFTVNPDDALRLLLSREHRGFLEPKEAVRNAFTDLNLHQTATAVAIQAALSTVLKRFDPKIIEERYKDAVAPQNRKAKCWEAYAEGYPELVDEIIKNQFDEEFVESYERFLRDMQKSMPH